MRLRLPAASRIGWLIIASALSVIACSGEAPAFGRHQARARTPAPQTEPPPIVGLRLKDKTALPATAPNAFRAGTKCDSDGDIFLQFGYYDFSRMRLDSGPRISEIIPDEKRIVEYGTSPLSQSDYPNLALNSFNVATGGVAYALLRARRQPSNEEPRPEPEYYVERFKNDGTQDSIRHIEAPPGAAHWFAYLFAVFPNGNFMILGESSRSEGQPGAASWQPFTGIYDASGRFISEVTLPEDVVNDYAEESGGSVQQNADAMAATRPGAMGEQPGGTGTPRAAAQGAARTSPAQPSRPKGLWSVAISTGGLVSGPDGNVWILRASDPLRLYAVDAGGQVVHHFQVQSPVPGLKPSEFGFAGSEQVYLQFAHFAGDPDVSSGPSRLVAVFNITSERIEGLYTLADSQKGLRVLACGDGRGGFIYIGGTPDNHLAVFDYGP